MVYIFLQNTNPHPQCCRMLSVPLVCKLFSLSRSPVPLPHSGFYAPPWVSAMIVDMKEYQVTFGKKASNELLGT